MNVSVSPQDDDEDIYRSIQRLLVTLVQAGVPVMSIRLERKVGSLEETLEVSVDTDAGARRN
jgi:hypothetical protein